MHKRMAEVVEWVAGHHNVIATAKLEEFGVTRGERYRLVCSGRLVHAGPGSFRLPGVAPTWIGNVAAAVADLAGAGIVAGRSASRLLHLDGFPESTPELLTDRSSRNRSVISSAVVHSTRRRFVSGDLVTVDGLRTSSAMRTILDSPLFAFSKAETENAIDSAIRLKLISESRLRERVLAQQAGRLNGNRRLVDALIDTGGESHLERRFLAALRRGSIAPPVTQQVFRDGARTIARVDAFFPCGLVVEVAGHATHATRQQRQVDAQRHTELTLLGHAVLTFTYEDLVDRPSWVVDQIRQMTERLDGARPVSPNVADSVHIR